MTANLAPASRPDPAEIVAAAILKPSSRFAPLFVGEGGYGAILDAMGETTYRHFHVPTTVEKALAVEDLEYLKIKGCFTLPAESKELLELYFEFVHPAFPVVDGSLFLQNYAVGGHEGINLLLLWSMFSVSASYSSISSRKARKETYMNRAKLLFDLSLENDKIVLIQSALLLSFWFADTEDVKQSWYWTGIAFSIVQTLGLHREVSSAHTQVTTRQRSLWCNIWQCCMIRDVWLAFGMSRPLRIKATDCTSLMAADADCYLTDMELHGRKLYSVSEAGRLASMWQSLIDASSMLRDIITKKTISPSQTRYYKGQLKVQDLVSSTSLLTHFDRHLKLHQYSARARAERLRVPNDHQKTHQYLTRNNTTNMPGIKDAITQINSLKPGEKLVYQKIADNHGVNRVTLMRHHKRVQADQQTKNISQLKLNPPQEAELVKYIKELTERRLPPTRAMIRNFACIIGKTEVSDSWVTRFINRNKDQLTSRWTSAMDSVRHKADSPSKYGSYFELLQRKIAEYDVEPEHTYNMDEKGFAIGVVGRSKRIFSKDAYEKKRVTAALQDGNREWVTVLAAVCADGSALPPGIIYPAAGKVVQASWVKDIDTGKHSVHFTTSPSGWTNDDIGLAWLEQIFDCYTKPKIRRKWRLLIVDGHGSHLTMDFINYCDENKILLAVFPPHSTHTLQPLDVVCFKPLASNYSNALAKRLHNTLGWVPIKKKDFFLLFWEAWESTFTKELILSSFEATGISPLNPNKVLDKFRPTTPETQSSRDSPIPVYSGKDWLKLKSLMRNVAKDVSNKESQRILRSFHHLSAQYELLNHEMQGIKETVVENKKHAAKQRALPL